MVDRVLVLVRHAMPDATPELPPTEWTLSLDGMRAAAALREVLPRDARLIASPEPKAWQTLGDVDSVLRDARFREIDRPDEPWSDDFRARRAEYVSGVPHRAWEPHADVAERFAAGVAAHEVGSARHVVIATHGMAMTTWLVALGAVARRDAALFWRGLRFPDCHIVDLDAKTVRRWPAAAHLATPPATRSDSRGSPV
jgi:broad specificity phosphatase PhoE